MANLDAPRGFKLYKMEGKTVRSRRYPKVTGVAIYAGDLVENTGSGAGLQAATNGSTNLIVGVAAAASLAADVDFVYVHDDPEASYICQSDGVHALTDVGLNVDIIATTGAGTQSKHELDISEVAVTSTFPLKIQGLAPTINGAANAVGANADLIVILNKSERKGTGSVGIV